MNITQKYNQLINEQITRSQFIEAARKDPSLKQWITSTTSYNDIIRILRNKNIIQEVKVQPKASKSLLKEAVEDSINYDSPITSRKEIEQSNGLAVGDEVKYIGNESKLQDAENLVISSIIDDGEGNTLVNIENIDSGEAVNDVPISDVVKAEFDLSEQNETKISHTDKKEINKHEKEFKKNKYSNPLGAIYNAKAMAAIKTKPKINENHIDWNNISLADAERLKDHYERTSILPYGLTPEQYDNIMQKYELDSNYSEYSLHERKNPIKGGKGDKLTIDDVNPTELRMGIKVEMEHTNDKDKAIDIALDHLAEHPFYYTQLKMAGLADELDVLKKSSKKRTDLPVEVDKKMSNTVDKANGTKPVKGFPNAKASANKAPKETVKPAKGVKQEKYTAKKAKGIKQTMALPGKEKKIKIQEAIDAIVKQILQEAASKAYGGWTVIKEPKRKSKPIHKEQKPSLQEDHLQDRDEQMQYILQHKDVIKQKDEITPEWFDGKTDQLIKKIYDAVETKVKQNSDLGDHEPEYHELKEININTKDKFNIVKLNGEEIKNVKFFSNGEWYQDNKNGGRKIGGKVPEGAKVIKSSISENDSCSCGCNSCGDKKKLNELEVNNPIKHPTYERALEIIESYEDDEILNDFLKEFPKGKEINEDNFKKFCGKYVDDYSEYFYINQNWKYIETGDESVFDDEYENEEDLDEGITTSTLRQDQKFTLSADMGEFKEGDEVEVVTINKTDQDIEVTLKDINGKTDTIYLDPNDDLNILQELYVGPDGNLNDNPDSINRDPQYWLSNFNVNGVLQSFNTLHYHKTRREFVGELSMLIYDRKDLPILKKTLNMQAFETGYLPGIKDNDFLDYDFAITLELPKLYTYEKIKSKLYSIKDKVFLMQIKFKKLPNQHTQTSISKYF